LPHADDKIVREFRRVWDFVLTRFAHVDSLRDKFVAADKDESLAVGSLKVVFQKLVVKKDAKPGRKRKALAQPDASEAALEHDSMEVE
jgi:hypothetical protein